MTDHNPDWTWLRRSFQVAAGARKNGNHPFGALLVGPEGELLMEAENSVVTGKDSTAHAETNLVRLASRDYSPDFLAGCTLYASTEPCPMCAGAIFWSGIGRVVYGVSEEGLYHLIGEGSPHVLLLSCREVLGRGRRPVEVVGPLLENEGMRVHAGFWNAES